MTEEARPPMYPGSYAIHSPDEAREKVLLASQHGVDFIKVLPGLSRESYLAIVDEAKRHGLPVAGHVPFGMTTTEVSDCRPAQHRASGRCGRARPVPTRELLRLTGLVTDGVCVGVHAPGYQHRRTRKRATGFQWLGRCRLPIT